MLQKHIENVRGKSEDYKKFYSLAVSIFFTGVVASIWVFSWLIPNSSAIDNGANVASAIDSPVNSPEDSRELTPTAVVKQGAGGVFNSLFDSVKNVVDGTSKNSAPLSPPSNSITKDGITVEAESPANVDIGSLEANSASSSVQNGSVDAGGGSAGTAGDVSGGGMAGADGGSTK